MTYIRGLRQNNIQVVTNSTGYSTQNISTSLVAVSGTEITYTPKTRNLGIVYECNYTMYWNPDGSYSYHCIRLQESTDGGSTWSTIPGSESLEGTGGEADYDTFCLHYTHLLSPWEGPKMLRLAARSYATYSEYTIGKCYTSSNTVIKSLPQVLVYEV